MKDRVEKSDRRVRPEPKHLLSGWKDIANYMGKGVRTVQRYEAYFGLPVRRPAGRPRGSVVATRAELDAWVGASPIRTTFRLTRGGESAESVHKHSTAAIRQGVTQLSELRDQMTALRMELRHSVQALRESVRGLQGELSQHRLT